LEGFQTNCQLGKLPAGQLPHRSLPPWRLPTRQLPIRSTATLHDCCWQKAVVLLGSCSVFSICPPGSCPIWQLSFGNFSCHLEA